jgi:hypothetical protein
MHVNADATGPSVVSVEIWNDFWSVFDVTKFSPLSFSYGWDGERFK